MNNNSIPDIIAGPIIRQVSAHQLTFWLVTNKPYNLSFQLICADNELINTELSPEQNQQIAIGQHAIINLITLNIEQALPTKQLLHYNFFIHQQDEKRALTDLVPDILYQDQALPNFVINPDIKQLFHGSCRKPHFDSGDGLVQIDKFIAKAPVNADTRPSMLLMTGDQVYMDDVAGPTLTAIHQTIKLLGLFGEDFAQAKVKNSDELYQNPHCYYQREQLLPQNEANKNPIFTSAYTNNHLVTLAEMLAMYILTWSDVMWRFVDFTNVEINANFMPLYQQELTVIEDFVVGLPRVARALAHIPTYMIFDDHDVTDDWNLTRGWEEAVYGHPFSKRIIGNALISYLLCQGWGNKPQAFTDLLANKSHWFSDTGFVEHDDLIEQLLAWHDWHYSLETTPKIIVLDTRTQRWRSESNANKPSGLMDWEALTELQQQLFDQPSVILISAAPIYGVKFIEAIQRVFTYIGKPLLVDAENWMAHKGSANVILNIFKHPKTPPNFIILSGDVHYSFVYEVSHRFRKTSAQIFQITASGIKNQFPSKLLMWLERLNRYLYASHSPLNWFTKRRSMKIKVRKPDPNRPETLINKSGIGLITLTQDNSVVKAELLTADDQQVLFHQRDSEDQLNLEEVK